MRVLITGGAGFFSGWITKALLENGCDVRIFDTKADRSTLQQIVGPKADHLEWTTGDIGEYSSVEAALKDCTAVIHLAGVLTPACRKDPILGARINVIGTLNVFLAARAHGIDNIIYTSSGGVFGKGERALEPASHYGAFKLANEGSARAFFEDDGISSTGFRPFVVYGLGRESGLSAGPTLACRAAAARHNFHINFTGPLGLVYAQDAALAYYRALSQPAKGARVFDMPGHLTSAEAVAKTIEELVPEVRISVSGPPLPSAAFPDATDMIGVLGLPDMTPPAVGLERTIDLYRRTMSS